LQGEGIRGDGGGGRGGGRPPGPTTPPAKFPRSNPHAPPPFLALPMAPPPPSLRLRRRRHHHHWKARRWAADALAERGVGGSGLGRACLAYGGELHAVLCPEDRLVVGATHHHVLAIAEEAHAAGVPLHLLLLGRRLRPRRRGGGGGGGSSDESEAMLPVCLALSRGPAAPRRSSLLRFGAGRLDLLPRLWGRGAVQARTHGSPCAPCARAGIAALARRAGRKNRDTGWSISKVRPHQRRKEARANAHARARYACSASAKTHYSGSPTPRDKMLRCDICQHKSSVMAGEVHRHPNPGAQVLMAAKTPARAR
jgi:hypothetical protein